MQPFWYRGLSFLLWQCTMIFRFNPEQCRWSQEKCAENSFITEGKLTLVSKTKTISTPSLWGNQSLLSLRHHQVKHQFKESFFSIKISRRTILTETVPWSSSPPNYPSQLVPLNHWPPQIIFHLFISPWSFSISVAVLNFVNPKNQPCLLCLCR